MTQTVYYIIKELNFCLDNLYKSSLRTMLGLNSNSSDTLCEKFIQYPFKVLGLEILKMAAKRWSGYIGLTGERDMRTAISIKRTELDMKFIPQKLINSYNVVYGHKAQCKEHNTTLGPSHLLLFHERDLSSDVEQTIMIAHEMRMLLKRTLNRTNFDSQVDREELRVTKQGIHNRQLEVEKEWLNIYNSISCLTKIRTNNNT